MQQILPIFPADIKMVNYQVGFKQMDDFVHYFVNGMPVYCHQVDDKNGYRYVLATLVNNKLQYQRVERCIRGKKEKCRTLRQGLA